MSIRFVCACGKHLRAHEEMAAHRSICPSCGRPVGIPSLESTQRGTEAEPLSLTDNPQRLEIHGSLPSGDFLRYRVVLLPDNSAPVKIPEEELTYRLVPLEQETLPPLGRPQTPRILEAEFSQPESSNDSASAPIERLVDHELAHLVRHRGHERPTKPRRRGWRLERYWFECLAYPFRAWLIIGGLGFAYALLVSQIAFVLPQIQEPEMNWPSVLLVGFLLFLLAYTCSFWQCTLAAAVTGEAGVVRWPGMDVGLILYSVVRCGVCFLAGPVFLIVAAFFFWYEYGDPEWIDQLILGELILVAGGYWLFAFMAVTEKDRLSAVAPLVVLQLIRRLKWQALVAVLLLGFVTAGHATWTWDALTEVHDSGFPGWFSLLCCWTNTLFWTTFLLRWLGVSSFYKRVKGPALAEVGER